MTGKHGRRHSRWAALRCAARRGLVMVVICGLLMAGAVADRGLPVPGPDGVAASPSGRSDTTVTRSPKTQVSVPPLRPAESSTSPRASSVRGTPDAAGSADPPLTRTGPLTSPIRPSVTTPMTNTSTARVSAAAGRTGTPGTPPTTTAPARTITLAFTGDVLVHTEVIDQAAADAGGGGYSFRKMFAAIAPVVRSADWAICHQETVIGAPGVDALAYPLFRAPYSMAADLREAGWDACDTASNHTTDHGQPGVDSTLQSLDDAHLGHTGSYRDQASARSATVYRVRGVRVGHIAATYGVNGDNPPHPWSVDIIDVADIAARARALKQDGVDIVVVSLHAGIEQQQQPSDDQLAWSAAIMASPDVDLFVGAHAHVVQPIRQLDDGRYVVYGLGNLLAWQSTANPRNRDGVIVMPTFTRAGDGRYRVSRMGYVPTATVEVDGTTRVQLAPPEVRQRVREILSSDGAEPTDLTDTDR